MPYYENSLFGPSEHNSSEMLPSPHQDSRRTGMLLPPKEDTDTQSEQPTQELVALAPSPIPHSPACHSYRDEYDDDHDGKDERNGGSCHVDESSRSAPASAYQAAMDEEVEEQEWRRPATAEASQRPSSSSSARRQPSAAEEFVSIPRAASSPRTPQTLRSPTWPQQQQRHSVYNESHDVSQHRNRKEREEGLVASYPRLTSKSERSRRRSAAPSIPSHNVYDESGSVQFGLSHCQGSGDRGDDVPHGRENAVYGDDEVHESCRAVLAQPPPVAPSASGSRASTPRPQNRHAVGEGSAPRADRPSGIPADGRTPGNAWATSCAQCGYYIPEEFAVYLKATATHHPVICPHCPACGNAMTAAVSPGSESRRNNVARSSNRYDRNKRVTHDPPPERQRQALPCIHPAHQSGRRKANPDTSASDSEVGDRGTSFSSYLEDSLDDRLNWTKVPSDEAGRTRAPPSSHVPAVSRDAASPSPRRNDDGPYSPTNGVGDGVSAESRKDAVVCRRSPYLTLDLLPHTLHAVSSRPSSLSREGQRRGDGGHHSSSFDAVGLPWAVDGCSACDHQFCAGLAGCCCFCAMPCVLFRERQSLLLHELRSRYICCAGAFPCCTPPALLRPELYFTLGPAYYARSAERNGERRAVGTGQSAPAPPQQCGVGHASSGEKSSAPPLLPFRSLNGVVSPASLVDPRTGLPLDGCYANMTSPVGTTVRGGRPWLAGDASSASASSAAGGYTCCGCIHFIDYACVWTCSDSDCLYCAHPTACCLACPLCCLCCEMTFCIPCAFWANRLLIRQHYHLAPDTAVDGGALRCYTCCRQGCTCSCTPMTAPHDMVHPKLPSNRDASGSNASLSCGSQLAITVAACTAAVCCLCPCAPCGLAQQRDQLQQLGYPLVMDFPPELEMM